MTVGQYLVASGVAGPTEQDTLNRLEEFMVGALGWERVEVISDTGADNSRVWFSRGEVPGKYDPLYCRIRAFSNFLYFYTYTFWNHDTSTGNDVNADGTESRIYNDCSGGYDDFMIIGNKDAVLVSIKRTGDGWGYVGGFGYLDTFYTPEEDPYPAFVLGQNTASDTFANTNRLQAYLYDPYGWLHTGSTSSGTSGPFIAQDLSTILGYHNPGLRDGRIMMLKNTFYRTRATSAVSHEVRGTLPGLYQTRSENFTVHSRVSASGTLATEEEAVGDYIISRHTATFAEALGPIVDYNPVPLGISDIEAWLPGHTVEKRSGNYIREWIDVGGVERSATQDTAGDRPVAVISGTGSESQPYVQFDDNDYLAGSIEVVNDYTVFAVARYVDSPDQQPIFYTRGAISANDYIFGLEFNTSVSGSASITVRSDGSPLEEDVLYYDGLFPDTFYILTACVSGTTTSLYVNGDPDNVTVSSDSKTTIAGSTTLSYGIGTALTAGGSAAGQARFEGDIAELLVYTKYLTNEERQAVIDYLGDKYGITVSGTGA